MFPSFLRLNDTLLYEYATFCLYIPPSIDTWFASTFWLLWTILQWTLSGKYLSQCLLSVLLVVYLQEEYLCLIVTLFNFLRKCQTDFSYIILYFHKQCLGFQFAHIVICCFLFLNIIDMMWHFIGVFWLAFLWWLMMLSTFSCTCCLFVCFLQRNVFWNSLYILF